MARLFVLAFTMLPAVVKAHEVNENVIGSDSHIMAHVMQAVFALSFAFCAFVVYVMYKDYQKKKTTTVV